MKRNLIVFFLWCIAPAVASAQQDSPQGVPERVNILALGAAADGKTLNTTIINKAIATLSASGGGVVYFPRGTYLTGTIFLRSNITLFLSSGATILGSTNLADYPENAPPRATNRLEYGHYALVCAQGQVNVAIIGPGRINGQGSNPNFTKKDLIARGWSRQDAYLKRPFGLSFVECKGVRVQDVTLEDLGFWSEDYLDCDDVVVTGVTVDSKKDDYNNDGIDIDSCRNVRVSDCLFNVGDDGVCLKASYRDCENITVTNCTVSSLANGIKLGTASNGGYRNIAISNCAIYETNCAGLALEIVDGGTLDGVTVSNIAMRDVGAAIFVRLGNMARAWTAAAGTPGAGILRNVSISNINATVWLKPGDTRAFACSITGMEGHPVENVTISDVRISTRYAVTAERARVIAAAGAPEVVRDYPEFSMFGDLPASGFFIRHAKNITLRNLTLDAGAADFRPAIAVRDVEDFVADGFAASGTAAGGPTLTLAEVTRATLSRMHMPVSKVPLLGIEGNCSDIQCDGHLSKEAKTAIFAPGANQDAVVFK